jgi:PleD family two-component response regulator
VAEISALSRIAHSFAGHAGIAGFSDLSQISSALVALLTELLDRPAEATDSSLRTVVDACDFLPHLLATSGEEAAEAPAAIQVLVVDDDVFCRRAVRQALTRLKAATLTVDDPQTALRLLQENPFSLILLDVEMPGLNGFDLCAALRRLPANAQTPVVFVTTLDGFESRDRAMACGGNDLIAKPFLPMELAVKALSLLRRRPANGSPVAAP